MPLLSNFRVSSVIGNFAASAAALICVLAAASAPTLAQDTENAAGQTYAKGPSGPGRGGSLTGRLDDDTETAPDLPAIIPADDPTHESDERDPLDPATADGQRPVIRDGDLSWPPEPRAPVDGIVQPDDGVPVRDGIDPLSVDTRRQEDIAAFESPPAGYNPLLFQIEDIPPIDDRRTRRLFLQEPFDPVGLRIGTFVLFPEAEIGGSWYSNVLRSSNAQSDVALDVRPAARLVSDWKTHALEFRAVSALSFFSDLDSENDTAYQLEARGRLDVTRRTNLQAFVSRDYSQESRSAIDANAVGDRANVTVDKVGATLNHRFNRLSLQLRGTIGEYEYSDVAVGNTMQSNADRDYRAYDGAVRTRWEFKPTLTGFIEVGGNQRDYAVVAKSDGISRDSTGERYRIGAEFGETSEILRGEISVGYGVQRPDDARLQPIEGILLDANVAWRVTKLTTLSFDARSEISETTTAGSGGVFTRAFGVAVRHAIQRQLIGTTGITYTMQDYEGIDIDESEWRVDVGLEYFLSREAVVFGRYRHTIFESTSPGADYTSDEVHVGLRLRR
ncbi:MAG: outer membrane beta-barrel protein [Hyphomicrobiaceae bacterium]